MLLFSCENSSTPSAPQNNDNSGQIIPDFPGNNEIFVPQECEV